MTVEVNSTMTTRQSIAVAQVIPQYRYSEGLGRRRLLTPDEVLRLPNDELLIIIRGQKVLRARKFDYTGHPYAKDCVKASIQDYKSSHSIPLEPEIIPEGAASKEEKPAKAEAPHTAKPPAPPSEKEDAPKPASEKPPQAVSMAPAASPSPAEPAQQQVPPAQPKPARRPKTLYESSRPPIDF